MNELTETDRKLLAYSLFSLAMKMGPTSFEATERIIKKLDLEKEYVFYANDWIDFADKNKNKNGKEVNETGDSNQQGA